MSVYQNRDRGNRWSYDFEVNKQRFKGYCIDPETQTEATTKREAKAIEAQLKVAARKGQLEELRKPKPTGSTYTFAEAVEAVMQDRAQVGATQAANLAIFSRDLLHFFKPATVLVEIKQARVDAYRVRLIEKRKVIWIGGNKPTVDRADPKYWRKTADPLSPLTMNYYLDLLRAVFTKANKTRDPSTGQSALPFPPDVKPFEEEKRDPTPMPVVEFEARREQATQQHTVEAMDLSRLFGLRRSEALKVKLDNIDDEKRGLRWKAKDVKGNADQFAYGGAAGWSLLLRLREQAETRGVEHLVTWSGDRHGTATTEDGNAKTWRPLKSLKTGWNATARRAGVKKKHRYHDIRARMITDVAMVASGAVTQAAARHADPATTQRYIKIASDDVANAVALAMTKAGAKTRPTTPKAKVAKVAKVASNVVTLKPRRKIAATQTTRKAA